jgi:hypothetical protein
MYGLPLYGESIYGATYTPTERTLTIGVETRLFEIASEDRTYLIPECEDEEEDEE